MDSGFDINALETKLKAQQWVGGQQPTAADKEAYQALSAGPVAAETHPHTFAWFCLVFKFTDAVKDSWPAAAAGGKKEGGKAAGKKGKGKKEEAPKKKDDDVDMDDLFGDDNEEDAEAAKKAAAAAKDKKKKKKKEAEMSMVMLEVKPLDDTTDLDKLAARIFADCK